MMKLLRHQRNVSKDAIALVNSRLLNFHPSCWYFYWCNLPLIARLLQMGILQFNLEVRVTFIIYSFHQNELFLFGFALLLESLSFWWISLLAALIKESAGVVILDVLLKVHITTKTGMIPNAIFSCDFFWKVCRASEQSNALLLKVSHR